MTKFLKTVIKKQASDRTFTDKKSHTAQKMKFSTKDFFSKCLLKKSLMGNFIFCAVSVKDSVKTISCLFGDIYYLTLPVPSISESCTETKIKWENKNLAYFSSLRPGLGREGLI